MLHFEKNGKIEKPIKPSENNEARKYGGCGICFWHMPTGERHLENHGTHSEMLSKESGKPSMKFNFKDENYGS